MGTDNEQGIEGPLAAYLAHCRTQDIPEAILHEARRSLVNVVATAFSGAHEPAIDIYLDAVGKSGDCTIIGRGRTADAQDAAFANAMSANIYDFDDTHEATILHPSAPVFAPLFAHAQSHQLHGRDLLCAFVLGAEVACRVALAVSPYHYAHGWHITSTCGIFGAAVAIGTTLELDAERMRHAIAISGVQSSGMVEGLGTMAKSVSVGGAARNGYQAALLAQRGLTGPAHALTGNFGYLRVYGEAFRPQIAIQDLGSRWEIAANTYKPYPVGVVLNPVIEAILTLRDSHAISLEHVTSVTLTGHPLLRQRTDRPTVTTGRETQVSAQHAIAIALLRGRAGLEEFSDDAAAQTLRIGRPRTDFIDDPACDVDSAGIEILLEDGRRLRETVEGAMGSRKRPLTDQQLETKFIEMAERAGMSSQAREVLDGLWNIDRTPDVGRLVRMTGGGVQ